MKVIKKLFALGTVLAALFPGGPVSFRALGVEEEGVALVIVCDTSGSMSNPVKDRTGQSTPKHLIAKRALEAVVKRLQTFVSSSSATTQRPLHAGLYAFSGKGANELIRLGPFDGKRAENWTQRIPSPSNGTPLGIALRTASQAVLQSTFSRRHVLVITDGVNSVGPDPASVLPAIKDQAKQKHADFSVHFIAFDVDAKMFDPLKKLGVTVVSASNESQLNSQLGFILEKKILLEDEEPPRRNQKSLE